MGGVELDGINSRRNRGMETAIMSILGVLCAAIAVGFCGFFAASYFGSEIYALSKPSNVVVNFRVTFLKKWFDQDDDDEEDIIEGAETQEETQKSDEFSVQKETPLPGYKVGIHLMERVFNNIII